MLIRELKAADWEAVRTIYAEGIATGNATFETKPPEWSQWDGAHRTDCRFIAENDGEIYGWSALTPVSARCVYAGVAEVSVYVSEAGRGKGVGRVLLQKLVESSEAAGIWTLQAGIFPENTASVRLHEKAGVHLAVANALGKCRAFGTIEYYLNGVA